MHKLNNKNVQIKFMDIMPTISNMYTILKI